MLNAECGVSGSQTCHGVNLYNINLDDVIHFNRFSTFTSLDLTGNPALANGGSPNHNRGCNEASGHRTATSLQTP